ncbi:sugar transferase [Pseudoruegeria sp. HB172150]|uniref:sugar transferase n=1 Tax=Pseudoruegeria sp. HB172150 TaxID=2721164 RepID=UPI001557E885|nr:sugar transferase [Pseudoruegeria sp. HB172150]
MFDFSNTGPAPCPGLPAYSDAPSPRPISYQKAKRSFDIVGSLLILLTTVPIAATLWFLNPWLNRGPLFFCQTRMGQGCTAFRMIKFRSMRETAFCNRTADSPLETDRITLLGRFLRRSRIDEFPQAINVLRGEMSLIGPRPDMYELAEQYLRDIPGYRERHSVRPGITGLAQTEIGYVVGTEETRRKVQADLHYISNASLGLEAWILWRSILICGAFKGS